MPLPRLHLFELEDQPWFPALLRRGMTDYLAEMIARTKPYTAALPLLRQFVERYPGATVVDLCSGGGGPWPQLASELIGPHAASRLVLTDAFPNPDALSRFGAGIPVSYRAEPQEAATCPAEAGTVRTLFSSFHHFAPPEASRILRAAVQSGTPIAVCEGSHRSAKALAMMWLVPIAVLALTPLIRPFRWWRLLFTYAVPLIPIFTWWDGTVSCLRTYRPEDLERLIEGPEFAGFAWTAGEVRDPKAPLPVTYLIGIPRAQADVR